MGRVRAVEALAARACEIRLRAERKAGQLLRDREKAQGKRTDLVGRRDQVNATSRGSTPSADTRASPKTLAELGISGSKITVARHDREAPGLAQLGIEGSVVEVAAAGAEAPPR